MQEKSIIKKNILKYLEFIGITAYKFYQETGITRGVLTQNNGMSEENTSRFLDYYKEVDAYWLITGKGQMLKKTMVEGDLVNEPTENYGLDYKELYLDAKYTIDIQKKYIESLELQLNNKRKAG